MYPLLLVTLLTGMLATFGDNLLFGEYHYRETVSPWFRSVFTFGPDPDLMQGAPFLFQAHAVSAWLLFAVWPFSRLVHAWSIPLTYLGRSWILFRSRNPRASLARQRANARAGSPGR
jgi:nitrate reductase gamma subunit